MAIDGAYDKQRLIQWPRGEIAQATGRACPLHEPLDDVKHHGYRATRFPLTDAVGAMLTRDALQATPSIVSPMSPITKRCCGPGRVA